MSDISDNARKLFNALPVEGKISGAKAKEKSGLSTHDYKTAKTELKKGKFVILGQGRGGTISRAEGTEILEPEVKTQEENLEIAREIKKEKTRAQKKLDETKAAVLAAGERLYPDHDKLVLGLTDGDSWYVEVWKDRRAKVQMIPEHEWSNE